MSSLIENVMTILMTGFQLSSGSYYAYQSPSHPNQSYHDQLVLTSSYILSIEGATSMRVFPSPESTESLEEEQQQEKKQKKIEKEKNYENSQRRQQQQQHHYHQSTISSATTKLSYFPSLTKISSISPERIIEIHDTTLTPEEEPYLADAFSSHCAYSSRKSSNGSNIYYFRLSYNCFSLGIFRFESSKPFDSTDCLAVKNCCFKLTAAIRTSMLEKELFEKESNIISLQLEVDNLRRENAILESRTQQKIDEKENYIERNNMSKNNEYEFKESIEELLNVNAFIFLFSLLLFLIFSLIYIFLWLSSFLRPLIFV